MFERYTEKARRVIFFARYEASQFGQPYIETEHLLLGLLREDKALTNRFLRNHASVESVRHQIETQTVIHEKVATSVDLPLSNDSKYVLSYAAEEAERLAHLHIGTEHLLLGLLRQTNCLAARLLNERGLHLAEVRASLAANPNDTAAKPLPPPAATPKPVPTPVRVVDAATQQTLIDWPVYILNSLPRIGETLSLSAHEVPARLYRVQNITWTCQTPLPIPEDIAKVQGKIQFIVQRMENAIANHEFEKARFYSEEERKERENLRTLLDRDPAQDAPDGQLTRHQIEAAMSQTSTTLLQEVVISVALV